MFFFFHTTAQEVKKQIGDLVRSKRKQRGLNQEEFASQLNVSRITISNLEQGKNITLDTLLKALQFFDLLENFHEYLTELVKSNEQESLY